MTYKTIVIDYAPKAKKMAAAIEKTANEKAPESVPQEKPSKDEAAPQAEAAQDEADVQEETAEAVGEAE